MSEDDFYLKYTALMRINELSQMVEPTSRQIMFLAHLYNASHLAVRHMPHWPDMEFVIRRQSAKYLFYGGFPTTWNMLSRNC
jgi:hypothetical protein